MFSREKLIDFFQAIINSISSGYDLQRSFYFAAQICDEPLKSASLKVGTNQEIPLEDLLCQFAQTLPCGPIQRMTKHLLFTHQLGSSLVEGLRLILDDVRLLPLESMINREKLIALEPFRLIEKNSPQDKAALSPETITKLNNLHKKHAESWESAKLSVLHDLWNLNNDIPNERTERVHYLQKIIDVAIDKKTKMLFLKEVFDLAFGYGPLEDLLLDPLVSSITVEGIKPIEMVRDGHLKITTLCFPTLHLLQNAIERMISPEGLRVDQLSPILTAKIHNGNIITISLPPISSVMILHIQKPFNDHQSLSHLVKKSMLTQKLLKEIKEALSSKKIILIAGSDEDDLKKLLISSLINEMKNNRIVFIEDTKTSISLKERQGLIRLFPRNSNIEGRGKISISALYQVAQSLKPDYIACASPTNGMIKVALTERSGLLFGISTRSMSHVSKYLQGNNSELFLEIKRHKDRDKVSIQKVILNI
jgi:Flp pilus assembly CpaF family ATPase